MGISTNQKVGGPTGHKLHDFKRLNPMPVSQPGLEVQQKVQVGLVFGGLEKACLFCVNAFLGGPTLFRVKARIKESIIREL